MPVLARRRYEIGEPVEELKRREFDDAISSRPRAEATPERRRRSTHPLSSNRFDKGIKG
jgi:hypothetical protein